MKKNKLIDLLLDIEGNPDIYLWNGVAEDWVDLDKEFVPMELYRWRKSHVKAHIHFEMLRDACEKLNISYEERDKVETPDFLKRVDEATERSYKEHYKGWHLPNQFLEEDRIKEWYDQQKTCYVINTKSKGKTTHFIRGGKVEY